MLISIETIIILQNTFILSKFARNAGLPFKTPEMFYHNTQEKLPVFSFNPTNAFKKNGSVFKNKNIKSEEIPSKNKESRKG